MASQFLVVVFRTQKDEVPASGTLSQVRQSDVVEEPFAGAIARSPYRTERRSLLHLSQGGKKRAIQLSCAGSFHLGFDHELVARFRDGAQLLKGVLDRAGVRAVDACLELEVHLGRPLITRLIGIVASRLVAITLRTIPSRDPWENESANLLTRRVQRHILFATGSGPLVSWLSSATPPA